MYFHVIIETNEKIGKSGQNKEYFELDKKDIHEIESRIIVPFINGTTFQFNGYFLKPTNIIRLVVRSTKLSSDELVSIEYQDSNGFIMVIYANHVVQYDKHSIDLTSEVMDRVNKAINQGIDSQQKASFPATQLPDMNKVFIVHGRDEHAKTDAARFIESIGYEAIILHEQVSGGKTIIEKIDAHTNVGFGLILYTPCDSGGLATDKNQKYRARQNVVFEHGYLIGKIGRNKVCALVKDGVETPNDINGVVYVPLDSHGAWKVKVANEMKAAGYAIDLNNIKF